MPRQAREPVENRSRRRRRSASVLTRLLGFFAVVILAILFIDTEQIATAIEGLSPLNFSAFLLLMMSTRVFFAARWWIIARRNFGMADIRLRDLVRVTFVADFVMIWFPSAIGGEAIRVWKVGRLSRQPLATLGSITVDRLVGLVTLAVVAIPLAVAHSEAGSPQSGRIGAFILTAALVILVVVLAAPRVSVLRRMRAAALEAVHDKTGLLWAFCLSMLSLGVVLWAYYVAVPELEKEPFSVVSATILIPRLGGLIPASLLGIGAIEASTAVIGKALGVETEIIVMIVAAGLAQKYVASLIGAISELGLNGFRFLELRRGVRPPSE